MSRRCLLRTLALILAPIMSAGVSLAQSAEDFPTKPITLIVPWNAGGSTDIYFRALGEAAGKELGQPVVVDNKAGGSGTLGPVTMALSAKPDGYTIAQIPVPVFRLPLMQKHNWDAVRDFSYIVHVSGYVLGLTTKATSRFKTWDDVVKGAKETPGRLTYATTGPGTTLHIGMEDVSNRVGMKMTMVPFKGGTETNAAALGGHTDFQADSTVWQPLVESGDLRLLVIFSESRNKRWPNVPTMKELGVPVVYDSPFGIAGPKGMDPAIVAKLHDAFKKALDDPKVLEIMERYDFINRYMSTADYIAFVPKQIEAERATLEKMGMTRKE